MFGYCAAGRPLETNLQQIDETHALFQIPAAEKVNHICVFLLGTGFPGGYGATVHLFWPGRGSQVLGMLSNEKPSAIFRIRSSTFSSSSGVSMPSAFTSAAAPTTTEDITAILGLAIEPLEAIAVQMAALPTTTVNAALGSTPVAVAKQVDPSALAERIARHLFNYISGFVPSVAGMGADSMVPVGIIARWYENFVSKVKAGGLGFLDKPEE